MSTPEKWLDAAALDAGLRALGNCTRNGDRICDMEREAAEWLMVNSVACAEQARAALSLRDELAALRVESQEGAEIVGELKAELAEWKDKLGAMTAAHRYATDELAECRAKLAAQIERCGLAELAVAQRDIPLAAAQAENVRLREAGRDLRLMATTQAPADHPLIVAWDRANADHGSRDALRKILRSAAVEAGRNCIETTEQLDALVARLLGEEGGQS